MIKNIEHSVNKHTNINVGNIKIDKNDPYFKECVDLLLEFGYITSYKYEPRYIFAYSIGKQLTMLPVAYEAKFKSHNNKLVSVDYLLGFVKGPTLKELEI